MRGRALAFAASLLAAGGWLYHGYWPRERTLSLAGDGPLAEVFLGSDLPFRAWIAYPHQNLSLLAASETWSATVELAADLGLPRLELPSFGPFAAPPARALAVATDAAGEHTVLAAEVYRLPAVLARLAGWLAGNPWLSGGRLETDGQLAEVTWRGSTWVVERRPGTPDGDHKVTRWLPSGDPTVPAPSLAHFALAAPAGPLPAGSYRLARRGGALELTHGAAGGLETWMPLPAAGPAVLAAAASADRVDALAVLPAAGELPDTLVFHRGFGRRWPLPAEPLHELVGRGIERLRHGAWEVTGSGREARHEAARLVPYLEQLSGGPADQALRFGLWVDLPAARRTLGPLAQQLARLPIAETRALAVAALALEGLAGWRSLSLAVVEQPEPAVLARLVP